MEENCHLLEFRLVTTGFRSRRVYGSSFELSSERRGAVEGLISKGSTGRITRAISNPSLAGWGGADRSPKQKLFPRVKSLEPKSLDVRKRVLLYCFRFGKCGTFMPLSVVRGEFNIAVVWTWLVAAFSASSVHFWLLLATACSLSAVKAVCAAE